MNKIFVIIIFLLSIKLFAQGWETQNSGVKSTLFSVSFIDTLNGWAVGDSSTILNTSDGGKNWIKRSCPVKMTSLRKVQFVSINTGFIRTANNDLFLATGDGGANWDTSHVMPDSSGFSIDDFYFVNETEGWLTSSKDGGSYIIGLILHTTNKGNTWEKQIEENSSVQQVPLLFTAIKFQDNKVGCALGGFYFESSTPTFVYKTANGGSAWNKIGNISFSTS